MTRTVEFRDALREAMSEEMRRDPRVFLLGEEVAEYQFEASGKRMKKP